MLFETLRADMVRKKQWYRKDRGGLISNLAVLLSQGSIALITFRYGHWAHHKFKNPILRILLKIPYWMVAPWVISLTQIRISVRAQIGKGFVIHGFSGIIIADAIIGENCTVNQQVTIGRGRPAQGEAREKMRPPPRLGNNVFVAAGAKVIGDVVIGDNVVIAPNSVVITRVPSNCTVIGVPAKVAFRDTSWLKQAGDK